MSVDFNNQRACYVIRVGKVSKSCLGVDVRERQIHRIFKEGAAQSFRTSGHLTREPEAEPRMPPVDLGTIQRATHRFEIDGRHDFKKREIFQKSDPFENRHARNVRQATDFAPVGGRSGGARKQSGHRIKGVRLSQSAAHGREGRFGFPQLRPMHSASNAQAGRQTRG